MGDSSTDAVLRHILEELQSIRAMLTQPPSITDDQSSWSTTLLHEFSTGTDLDRNGEIYGHTFVFNQLVESLPPSLKGIQKEASAGWKGKSMTLIDFIGTLPEGDRRNQAIRWAELIREQNRKL